MRNRLILQAKSFSALQSHCNFEKVRPQDFCFWTLFEISVLLEISVPWIKMGFDSNFFWKVTGVADFCGVVEVFFGLVPLFCVKTQTWVCQKSNWMNSVKLYLKYAFALLLCSLSVRLIETHCTNGEVMDLGHSSPRVSPSFSPSASPPCED